MGLFRRNKNIKKPVIRQIIDLVPRWLIESCAKKHKSDKGCSKYKTYDQFIALTYGQLNKCYTLNDISTGIGGLSPFQPEKVSFESGRIMLNRIEELLKENESFAFETTLSTKSYKNKIMNAKVNGYNVTLLFFWLQNIELAKERVRIRVLEGGHNIEPDVIERRYKNGLKNLFKIYLPIVDGALIFDNSEGKHELLAIKTIDGNLNITNKIKFDLLKTHDNS